jgi:hypothetical protein
MSQVIADAKVGDVIHFTNFAMATAGHDVWAIVTTITEEHDADLFSRGVYVDILTGAEGEGRQHWITYSSDTGVIVPEDQWPDEICTALAKRALLGYDECT